MVLSALALAFAAAAGWSLYDLLRKFLADRLPALTLVALVTLGALPPLALWTVAAGDWRIGPGYLLPGLVSVALNVVANLAYFRALQLSPLSVTLPLLSLTPAFTALLAAPFLGERLTPSAALGVVLVVAGALGLHLGRAGGRGARALLAGLARERGSLLMALVALCWSVTLLLDKVALRHAAPVLHALVLHAGVAAAAVALLAGRGELRSLARAKGLLPLLAASVLCGAVTITVQLAAIRGMEVALVETIKRGVGAVLALAWGRAFFAEPLTAAKLGGVGLMIAGVALLLA
ncbi:MAG: DMT family transporter [Thermoanaerobaculia bacterium]|nr:DMT family transporter [Thermoanaerobaculia bacterium]